MEHPADFQGPEHSSQDGAQPTTVNDKESWNALNTEDAQLLDKYTINSTKFNELKVNKKDSKSNIEEKLSISTLNADTNHNSNAESEDISTKRISNNSNVALKSINKEKREKYKASSTNINSKSTESINNQKPKININTNISSSKVAEAKLGVTTKVNNNSSDSYPTVGKIEENHASSSSSSSLEKGVVKNSLLDTDVMKTSSQRNIISEFPYLSTSTDELINEYKEIVPLMSQVRSDTKFRIGLVTNLAFNEGYISQTGVSLDYFINSDWSLNSGIAFEYSNYDSGSVISVIDKVYSFGSKLLERSISMNKRTAINLPLRIKKTFNKLSAFAGFSLNYHIAGNGTIDDGEGNIRSVWVSNDVFNPLTINYQLGASYLMNRRLELNVGLSYRNNGISSDVNSEKSGSKIYPNLGFNYLIAKH